jgi:hypothetical protein
MLCYLLSEELTILAFGDNLYCVILSCRPIETVTEGFAHDRVS